MSGQLVLVATPIGNLGDITERAVQTLQSAHAIACEDTRHSGKLLSYIGVRGTKLLAVHQHNEVERSAEIVERIRGGEMVALITDAGMPAVSDPGARLVSAVAEAGLSVSVIPGPSAVPAAVAVSGFVNDRFSFEGFIPRKGHKRRKRILEIAEDTRTVVVYEAPHRLVATVDELALACGDERRVVLVRELTKIHEEVWRGSFEGLRTRLSEREPIGECVLVIEGAVVEDEPVEDDDLRIGLDERTAAGMSRRDAAAAVADAFGVAKRRVYDLTIKPVGDSRS